jgi:hypothetical protein
VKAAGVPGNRFGLRDENSGRQGAVRVHVLEEQEEEEEKY